MEKRFFCIAVAFCLCISLLSPKPLQAETVGKRVLFISSYTESFASVPDQIKGIKETFDQYGVLLDIEYMDAKRLNTKENLDLFYATLKYKLNHVAPYDAIIVGDDHALDFAVTHQEELFPNLPIVFLCINDLEAAEKAARNKYITGIIEETPIKDNIELALKFNPSAKKVVAFLDNTLTGLGDRNQYYRLAKDFPELTFSDINVSDYSFAEIVELIKEIDENTIVLYLNMYTDKYGQYITTDQAARMFKKYSKVPVYRASFGGVGEGLLGGKMFSYVDSGRLAAEIVIKVFNGTPIETIDIVRDYPTFYMFDYEMIKHYNIDEKLIPKGSIIVNKKVTFYDEHKNLVLGTFAVFIILLLISFIVTVDDIKRRAIQKSLEQSHKKLEATYQELSVTYEELAATEEELRSQYKYMEKNAKELEILHQKYQHSIYSTNSVVWEYNADTQEVNFSVNIKDVLALPFCTNENIYYVLETCLDEESRSLLIEQINNYRKGLINEINITLPFYVMNNQRKWIKIRGKSIGSEGQNMLYGILSDITKEKEQEEHIYHMAHYDSLTDLPNRIVFMQRLQKEVQKNKPLLIMMMDIDNFKEINDTLGHLYGDQALVEIGNRLKKLCSDNIFISRFGGDEFLILISNPSETGEEEILKIQELFKKPLRIGHSEHVIKCSIGITRYPEDSTDINQLIINADTAMYKVKHGGKDNYLFYNKEMQEELKQKAEIYNILQKAVTDNSFYLVYQPQISAKTGEIVSFEALLRIKNHDISPQMFIQIAEESDLIYKIGRIVTRETLRQLAEWKDKGFSMKPIAFNFSSKQIKDKNYLDFLVQSLKEFSVDPRFLEIEITESILLEETDNTLSFLEELKKIGVKIALDDFGTGFSSINYLTYIPVDKVKLDKALLDKFLSFEDNKVINSIISLVHSLGLLITAEGIEDKKHYKLLKESGCDYLQGYLFSKPLKAEEAEKIYNTIFHLSEM